MSSTLFPGSTTPLAPASSPAPAQPNTRRVVDAPIRVFHALFALCFLGAYVTAEGESLRLLHVTLGYTLAGLLGFRVVYGLIGPRHARLSLMARKLSTAPQWLGSMRQAASGASLSAVNWRQGQNLLIGVAVIAMLVLVVPLTLSGYGTYNEWGDWLGEVHELVGSTFLAVVLAHLGLIALMSVLRKKNLALQMVHGRTEGSGPDLVKRNHAWLAVLMLVAVLAYWTWEWQQSPRGLISAQAVSDWISGNEAENDDD